jgi:hypothetical protein
MRALCRPNDAHKRIFPRGLDASTLYEVTNKDYNLCIRLSGAAIMNVGLVLPLKTADEKMPGDFKTFVFNIKRV